MTHHTEAVRAAFEAWARDFGTWEVKRDDDVALGTTGYTDITLTVAWHAVQAARRAPAAPVQQGWKLVPIVSTFEMDEAGMHPENETPPAIYRAMLDAAPQPPEAAEASVSNGTLQDTQPPENTREGAPYSNPEFEKLAREHAVWGTAQSALCAQFWLAALAQRAPLTKEEISEIMKLVGKYGTAVEANSTGNPSDYTLALEEARAFDAVRFRLLTIERNDGIEAQGNSQQT